MRALNLSAESKSKSAHLLYVPQSMAQNVVLLQTTDVRGNYYTCNPCVSFGNTKKLNNINSKLK